MLDMKIILTSSFIFNAFPDSNHVIEWDVFNNCFNLLLTNPLRFQSFNQFGEKIRVLGKVMKLYTKALNIENDYFESIGSFLVSLKLKSQYGVMITCPLRHFRDRVEMDRRHYSLHRFRRISIQIFHQYASCDRPRDRLLYIHGNLDGLLELWPGINEQESVKTEWYSPMSYAVTSVHGSLAWTKPE